MPRISCTIPHTHSRRGGTVCNLTRKFVLIRPSDNPTDIICILPKSLAAYSPDGQRTINTADDYNEHDSTQSECEHALYNNLDETQDIPVANGYVSFTQTFGYLGSLISYNLHNDNDITSQLAAANASMGKLKEIWRNPHLDAYNKYLLFYVIPMNLLLWGAETW